MKRSLMSRRGQSIVEALVALAILSVGLVGVLTLLSRSIYLQRTTDDETKATYLAAEGIEIAKSLIDHNVYLGIYNKNEAGGWAGLGGCFDFSNGTQYYYLDINSLSCPVTPAGSSVPDPLKFAVSDPTTGEGQYFDASDPSIPAGAKPTDFSRVVAITRPNADTIDVVSTVTWNAGAILGQSLTLEDTFYNWHP